eukprot:15462861-Alexandrium_andersonii.AAC.1
MSLCGDRARVAVLVSWGRCGRPVPFRARTRSGRLLRVHLGSAFALPAWWPCSLGGFAALGGLHRGLVPVFVVAAWAWAC